jgi:DNA-binding SARP family transcriptional activator
MEFGILGPLEVRDGGATLTLGAPRQRAVLALLLLHPNQVVPADRLIDELWGDEAPETAKVILQGYISGLRKILGAHRIATRAAGYVIELEPDRLDLLRFEALLVEAGARAAEGEPAAAAARYRDALRLWRGPALVDFAYESFAQAPISRLEELRLTALEKRIDADLALGRHADLVAELESLVAEHPLREPFRAQLMLALYRSARQAEALDVYRAGRRLLVDELGIDPSQALQELEQAILRQDAGLAPGLPAAAARAADDRSPERAILALARDAASLDAAASLAEPLARQPPRELVLALLVAEPSELAAAAAWLEDRRDALVASGSRARSATFTSEERGADAARLAGEQSIDLLLVGISVDEAFDERFTPDLDELLVKAPCDVGILLARPLAARRVPKGPVLVPFGGAEHEWAAAEVGAWIARSLGVRLRLVGAAADPERGRRDASRLLASASLAVQQVSGVVAEPVIVGPGPEGVAEATRGAGLVVLGLSDRWRSEGLGSGRLTVVRSTDAAVLLVRGGVRPGGLAPHESLTRYTWSLGPRT